MYFLSAFRSAPLDPQDPAYLDRLAIENIKKIKAVSFCLGGFLCLSVVCVYFVSRSHFRNFALGSVTCFYTSLAGYVIHRHLLLKKSQKALAQINKPNQKFFELDGFIKVESKTTLLSSTELKTEKVASNASNSSVSLTKFPKEMLGCIFVWLNARDLGRLSQCCKLFRETLNKASFFKLLIKKDFGLDLSEDNLKEEYRRLFSWRKCIYTRYRCLMDNYSQCLIFNNSFILVKKHSLETTNGSKIVEIPSPDHFLIVGSLIFIIRDHLEVFNLEGKHLNSIPLSDRTSGFLAGGGYRVMRAISLSKWVIVTAYNSIFILDKTNGKLLEKKELGDVVIRSATWFNEQLLISIEDWHNLQRDKNSILIYSLKPTLKEEKKIKRTNQVHVDTLYDDENKQVYLRELEQKTISLHISNKLDNPFSTFNVPPEAKRSGLVKGEKYVWFSVGAEIQIRDLIKEITYKIDFSLEENSSFSIAEYKNFLIFSSDKEICMLDLTLPEKLIPLMKRVSGTIESVFVFQHKLIASIHYGFGKAGIEVFDFGNFG